MPRHAAIIFDRPARPPHFTLLSHRFSPALSTAKDDLDHKLGTVSESETFFRGAPMVNLQNFLAFILALL